MKAVNDFLIVDRISEHIQKTSGGLEITESAEGGFRVHKGVVISSGPDVIEDGAHIAYDGRAGFDYEDGDNVFLSLIHI